MSNSLNLIESLAQDRHAKRYSEPRQVPAVADTAAAGCATHLSDTNAARRTTRTPLAAPPSRRTLETTRRRAGWLLVGLGLRLVAPARATTPAAQRTRLIGQ